MNFHKHALLLMGTLCLPFSGFAEEPLKQENQPFAIVNFSTCLSGSKYGKKEQEHFDRVRKQVMDMIEKTDSELKEVTQKLEDTEYMESLSPKAEEKLKSQYKTLSQDLASCQSHFYQILQQTHAQSTQKILQKVAAASKEIAQKENISYVLNKELCFYHSPDLDITEQVLDELDQRFEIEQAKELAKKEEEERQAKAALAQTTPSEELIKKEPLSIRESDEHFDDNALSLEETLDFDDEDADN